MKSKLRSLFIALSLALVLALGVGPALAVGANQQAQFAIPILIANTSFLNVRTGPGAEYTVLVTVVGGTEMPALGVAGDGVWYLVATSVGNGWVNLEYVIPRGDFRNVPEIDSAYAVAPVVVPWTPVTIGLPVDAGQGGGLPSGTVERFRAVINVESVNLRATPTMEGPVLRVLFKDDSVDYAIVGRTNDSRNVEWLAIHVPGVGTGWVESAKLIVRLSGRYHDVLTVVGSSVGVLQVLQGNFLNVAPLQQGDEVFLLETSLDGQFIKVELPQGAVGWIPFASVIGRQNTTTDDLYVPGKPNETPVHGDQGGGVPVLAMPTAIVNTGNLNIRSGPGAQFTTVATVPGGTHLGVIAIASDDVWYLVAGPFGQGWVNKEFVVIRGNLSVVPTIPWDEAAAQAALQAPIAVVSASLVLYAAPGTQYAQVGTLVGPAEVAIVARTGDFNWVQLHTSAGYGWVPAAQIVLRGDANLIAIV